jgi:hypothetical protein
VADPSTAATEAMSSLTNREYWEVLFSIEVSALYHDWRRSTLWTIVRLVRTVTLGGAVVALITALSTLHATLAVTIIAAVSVVSANCQSLGLGGEFQCRRSTT